MTAPAPTAPTAPTSQRGPLRVAVIGCGDISAVHLAAIKRLRDANLVALCDTDAPRLAAAAATHGVPGFPDHQLMFEQARPDVVHICTPHSTHAQLAIDALHAGIHVVLEKPLATSRDDAQRIIDAAEQSAASIAVCFQNRYNAPVQAAKALLQSGETGRVLGASATVFWHRDAAYYRSSPWRGQWSTGGGGLLMNQAIHTVDLLQWLVGAVAQVRGGASTRTLSEIEVEDTADMVLEHADGAVSTFFATLSNAVNAPVTIDIVTERATLSLRTELTVSHEDGRVEVVRERATATGDRAYWGVSHELLISDFYDGLAGPTPFWIGPAEAQKSLEIVQSVYDQSYGERR